MNDDYFCRNRYFWRSKRWYANLNNVVINYRHKGEDFDLNFCHLLLPKMQIDRVSPVAWCWRGYVKRSYY